MVSPQAKSTAMPDNCSRRTREDKTTRTLRRAVNARLALMASRSKLDQLRRNRTARNHANSDRTSNATLILSLGLKNVYHWKREIYHQRDQKNPPKSVYSKLEG